MSNVFFLFIVVALSSLFVTDYSLSQSPGSTQLIAEFALEEGDIPMSNHPNWNPQRILVLNLAGLSGNADIRRQVESAAGDVKVDFVSDRNIAINKDLFEGYDVILSQCRPNILANADQKLVWFHNYNVGVDRCSGSDPDFFEARVFTNGQKLSGPGIADHGIAMMLALARNFPAAMEKQSQKTWDRSISGEMTFGEIRGKTILVAGLGGIGTRIAERAHGLGMRVIATRNSSRTGPDFVDYVGLADELNTLAAQADVVVNALPLTESTTSIFDKTFFNAVKPNSIFISLGRGRSTVNGALVDAVESGKLYGVGLDVTDPEPLPSNSPLWTLRNSIITPHISSSGLEARERFNTVVIENIRRYVAGEPLLNVVDMSEGY